MAELDELKRAIKADMLGPRREAMNMVSADKRFRKLEGLKAVPALAQ